MNDLRILQDFKDFQYQLDMITKDFKTLNNYAKEGDVESPSFVKKLTSLEKRTEKLAIISRTFPFWLPDKKCLIEELKNIVITETHIEIEYTQEQWFHAKIPGLLPKKGQKADSVEYIRTAFLFAMKKFFGTHKVPIMFGKNVLIFCNGYSDHAIQGNQFRDHDNIETNAISDIVMMFCAEDDSPFLCSHFYCSAASDTNQTDIYLVPEKDFAKWYGSSELPHPVKGSGFD